MIGLILLGLLVGGAALLTIAALWENIENWLLTVVANSVENTFGYSARKNLIKAVSCISRVANKIKNVSTIYFKNSDNKYMEAKYEKEFDVKEVDQEVIDKLNQKDVLINELNYQ